MKCCIRCDGASRASSGGGVEGGIFAVERRLVQWEIDIVLNPCGEVFGGKQMGFVLLPVLAPAVLEGLRLVFLRKPRDEVGVAGGDALLLKRLGHIGDEL